MDTETKIGKFLYHTGKFILWGAGTFVLAAVGFKMGGLGFDWVRGLVYAGAGLTVAGVSNIVKCVIEGTKLSGRGKDAVDAEVAKRTAIQNDYDELLDKYNALVIENDNNKNEITVLKTEKAALQNRVEQKDDALVEIERAASSASTSYSAAMATGFVPAAKAITTDASLVLQASIAETYLMKTDLDVQTVITTARDARTK